MLIIFGGLPGTGKTTLARALAGKIGAVYLRIDSIEVAILASAIAPPPSDLADAGYRAAQALAEDNLRLGHRVVSDCVNDWEITRAAWRDTADRAGARFIEIEVVCSDPVEHRRRVEERVHDRPVTWQSVKERDYHAWDQPHIVIDTAGRAIEDCVAELQEAIRRA